MSRMTTLCVKWGVALMAGFSLAFLTLPAQAGMTVSLRFASGDPSQHVLALGSTTNHAVRVFVTIDNNLNTPDNVNGHGDDDPTPGVDPNFSPGNYALGFLAFNVRSHTLDPGITVAIPAAAALTAPFNGIGSQNGARADYNGDGSADWGSNAAQSDVNVVRPRATEAVWDYIPQDPNHLDPDTFEPDPILPDTRTPNPSGTRTLLSPGIEFLVATVNLRATAAAPGLVRYEVDIPAWILGAVPGANWWQASNQVKSGTGNITDGLNSGSYVAGSGVEFFVVPEPGTLTLAGLGLVGLASAVRRRRG